MAFGYLLAGIALLGTVLLMARWFVNAQPSTLIVALKWIGGALAALLVLYLVVSGRAGAAMAMVIPAFIILRRLRAAARLFPGGGARPSPGQGSDVETAYLRMHLDHDTGEMDGEVLRGPFAGRSLSGLGLDELLDLLGECARADMQSVRVLEAYLDRGPHRDWRERMDARVSGRGGAMTAAEAREILGVGEGASETEIKDAHRRLMQSNHPDHGGSTYLAAKINRAREILLGD